MTEIESICMINASGTFLTEHLTVELWCGDKDKLHEFIELHKCKQIEDYTEEEIVQVIINQADSQKDFLNSNLTTLLKQKFDLEDLDVISNAVTSEIWYDAHAFNDVETLKIIQDTKQSMEVVSSTLHDLIVSNEY